VLRSGTHAVSETALSPREGGRRRFSRKKIASWIIIKPLTGKKKGGGERTGGAKAKRGGHREILMKLQEEGGNTVRYVL